MKISHHQAAYLGWFSVDEILPKPFRPHATYFDAMNAAVVSWVQFYRDPFVIEPIEPIPPPENPSYIETANEVRNQIFSSLGVPREIIRGD